MVGNSLRVFVEHYIEEGILYHLITPYTLDENGVVERQIKLNMLG
jgi:hypothetical protein